MRDPRAIRSLLFLLAAATFGLQPFSAFCNEPAPATPEKDAKQNAAQRTPGSNLPKVPFAGEPRDSAEAPDAEKATKDNPKQQAPLSIPFVEGYDSLDLKIPDFDSTTGVLKSFFSIGALRRLDDKHVEIRQSFVGLYKPDGSVDLSVDVTKASLDRFTRKLTSRVPVIIWSDEFQITGATMELDTVSKEAKLGGPVRVLIYQAGGESNGGLDDVEPAEKKDASRADPQERQSPDASGVKRDKIK